MTNLLYRSPVTRWVLTATATWVCCVLVFGDPGKWQSAPSLDWLKHAHVPLAWWGVAFLAYGLLLIPTRTRPVGFSVGAVLWGVFAVSLIATVGTAGPKSAPAIAGLVDLAVFHGYAVKTALAADAADRGQQ